MHTPLRLTPFALLTASVVFGLLIVSLVLFITTSQPWLGLVLKPIEDSVVVSRAAGPSAKLPVGTIITNIRDDQGELKIQPLDLTVEPDGAMGDYATYHRFLQRQEILSRMQASGRLVFTDQQGSEFFITPGTGRPFTSLGVEFWVQVSVGFIAWLISAAVFAYRSADISARYLLLSGAATLTFAPFAAVYSTRELALSGSTFEWLNDANFLGGSLFTASFVALLLNYPRRIGPAWAGQAVVFTFIGWFILQQLGVFDSMTFARRFLVIIGVLSTFILAGIHWFASRKEPVARASLQWFLLSWMLGTCVFGLFILLPQLFGMDTSNLQGYAFSLFLLVYIGLAFGILRYRLFDLGLWWARIVLWALSLMVLVISDLLLLYVLNFTAGLSLSLALLVTGLVWLPLRAFIWNRVFARPGMSQGDLFARIVDIALTPPGIDQSDRWQTLLHKTFKPLTMHPVQEIDQVGIQKNGLDLLIPATGSIPAQQLEYAYDGRKLFNSSDLVLAGEMVAMLRHAIASRSAYEKGVNEERERIARDIHDNIGSQLLSALHSREATRKDEMIRETITDLRDVINNASSDALSLEETLADLRVESSKRLHAVAVETDWKITTRQVPAWNPQIAHALRSVIREAINNVIKHAEASKVIVRLDYRNDQLTLTLRDNGKGFAQNANGSGKGLHNLRNRIEAIQGHLEITSGTGGVILSARIPLPHAGTPK